MMKALKSIDIILLGHMDAQYIHSVVKHLINAVEAELWVSMLMSLHLSKYLFIYLFPHPRPRASD
jgi:hypothetical protein